MAGGIFTAANPTFVARELAYQLKDSGAKFLFAAEGSLETAVQAAKEAGLGKERVRWFDADVLFEKDGANKGRKHDVEYWSSVFAGPEEAKGFQWNELKGEFSFFEVGVVEFKGSGVTNKQAGTTI